MNRFVVSVALSIFATSANADMAGLRITELFLPHHDEVTRVAVWYPSISLEEPTLYAANPVFEGVHAHLDAEVANGQHPVVIFSHGMGGTDRTHAWLGAALAERGAITVLVNHPNSSWGDFDMSDGVAHWTRAQDLSVALDTLLASSMFSKNLDMSRVMAAGFSYGGWTALSLGGAMGNHAGIVRTCETFRDMEACDLLLSQDVNMQGIDPDIWNASYADPRVTHVTAIDPGFVWGLEKSDLTALVPLTLLIGFGGEGDRMLAADFDRSGLSSLLSDGRVERFDPAYHFTAMPICTPAGAAILEEENDDPVCTDPVGSDRAKIHAEIVDLMAEALGL